MARRWGWGAAAGLFALLCVVFYHEVIFSSGRLISFWHQDTFRYVLSQHYLTFADALKGLRLWNPYIFMGMPLATHPAYPLFYPLDVIFFFLPLHLAMNYSFILNTFLCGICMFAFVRFLGLSRSAAVLAGIVYMFNSVVLLHTYAGHLQTLQTLPWIPLFFLSIEHCLRKATWRAVAAGGMVLGVQLLAGNAQFSFYTLLGGITYGAWMSISRLRFDRSPRQRIIDAGALAGMVAIGCAIAAVKLIPSLEFMKFSDRNVTQTSFVGVSSYYGYDLLTYLLPELYGDILGFPHWTLAPNGYWEMCAYVGVIPLLLGLVAVIFKPNRRTAFFSCAAVIAVFASLGPRTPLFWLLSWLVPGFTKFRVHARFTILVVFCIAMLCAYGLDYLVREYEVPFRQQRLRRGAMGRFIAWAGFCVAAAVGASVFLHFHREALLPLWSTIWPHGYWSWGFVEGSFSYALYSVIKLTFFFSCGFFMLFLLAKGHLGKKAFVFFICLLAACDLWAFSGKYVISAEVKRWGNWDKGVVEYLRSRGPLHSFRVVSMDEYDFFPNKAIMDGIHMLDGYDAIFVQRRDDYFKLWSDGGFDLSHNLRLLSINNLRFAILKKEYPLYHPAWEPVFRTGKDVIWENGWCLPRVSLVHGVRHIANNSAALLNLLSRHFFDPLSTVLLEEEPPVATGYEQQAMLAGESVAVSAYAENEISVEASLKEPGYVVLADIFYPGWFVYVYERRGASAPRRLPCLSANYLFRGVGLPAGEYRLRFAYEPRSLAVGLWISIVALAAACAVFLPRRRRR